MAATDISRAELLKLVRGFEPVLEISPIAIVVTDLDANVVAWNPGAERVFGYTAEEAIGHNLDDLVAKTEELHASAVEYSQRAAKRHDIHTITRRTRKDGSLVDVELLATSLVADGKTVGTLGAYHDVTDLRRQQQFYEALLRDSPTAIVTVDPVGKVTSWNPAAEQLFGYSADEVLGRNVDELIAQRDDLRSEAAGVFRRAQREGQVRVTTRRTRKDGSLVDVDLVGAPISVGGEVLGLHAMYHDISELQRQKRYFQSILELSPTAIVVTDLHGNVTSWNPAAEQLFGYSAEEAVGRDLDDLVARRDDLHAEALANTAAAIRGERVDAIARRTRKDGSLVDVHVISESVVIGDERLGSMVVYHDISEIQRQKRYYEALVEVSPTAIIAIDPQGIVTAWNPASERLFGYSDQEAIGRHVDDLVANRQEIHEEALDVTRRIAKGEVSYVGRRTRKDGSLVDVQVTGAPIFMAGELVGMYGLFNDISEIQHQRRLFETLVEASPVALILVDPDSVVTAWNPAAERLFGYTPEEAIGARIDDLVARSDEIREEAATYSDLAARGQQEIRAITRRTRKDGTLVDVELLGVPLFVAGDYAGYYLLYHDISELQRQRRYYQALVQSSPVAIALLAPDGTVTSWNPAAERLFGYATEEAIGRNVDSLVAAHDEIRKEAEEQTRRGVRGGSVHSITKRTRKDGTLVDVETFGAPVIVAGEPVGLYAMYHDISEIQRQRQFYESLVEVSPVAVVLVDNDITITSWNPAAERLFGYTANEAIGRNLDDLVAANDEIRKEAEEQTREGMRRGFMQSITKRTRKDGTFVDVELLAVPVIVGDERAGFYVLYHDISEIQRQRQFYESLVEGSPVAVVTVDTSDMVTSWNPAAESLFGYTAEEAIGRHVDSMVANREEVREEAEMVNRMARQGNPIHLFTRRTRKDGSLVDVEFLDVPIFVAGERVGGYSIYHDITELQKARREAEAATQAKSAFLATMSHEIRTPLNAVIGMTGLLLDTTLGAEQRRYAEVIRSSADALLAVINDILDFSKIEAGRLDLESAPFDLRECVESALELVAAGALTKGLDVAYDMDPEVPVAVIGDATRLRQILLNLLNNAVKFTVRGEVVVTVGAERLDGGAGGDGPEGRFRLHFAVRDTGIGVPPDRMDRLFESFSQVDPSTTRRYGGTGLGLAISKRLAEQMGGAMWAESRMGEGSTFHFTVEATAAPAPVAAQVAGTPQLAGRRVLIVDDNATNRHILSRQTGSWGMLPSDTGSPVEALEWIRRGDPFDVAILDMQMPEMDGITLAREIRQHRDDVTLPLVLLTSLGRVEEQARDGGLAAYLTKPIRPSQLLDALMGVLRAGPSRREPAPAATIHEPLAERLPLRILLVEDNAVNQQLATLMLQKLGYRADVAGNGIEALEALERQPYDLVLMDVEMPEMDGLEATREIRRRWPGSSGPRIIAVTANALAGERERTLRAGMDDYMSKPLRIEQLAEAVARVAPRREGGDQASVLDEEAMRRLAGSLGARDAVVALIDTFLAGVPGHVATLRAALDRGELEEVRRVAHTLKSNAATFGAASLEALCRELEAAARAGRRDAAPGLVDRVERELEHVTKMLRDAREGVGS